MNSNLNPSFNLGTIGPEVKEMFAGLQPDAIELDFVPRSTKKNDGVEYSSTRLTCLTDDENTPADKRVYST